MSTDPRDGGYTYQEYTVRNVSTGLIYGPHYRLRDDAETEATNIRWTWADQQWEVVERDVTISRWRRSPHPDEIEDIDDDVVKPRLEELLREGGGVFEGGA